MSLKKWLSTDLWSAFMDDYNTNIDALNAALDAGFGHTVDFIGDGATDATTAIQAVLTAAAVAGGTVYIPDGTYMIQGESVNDATSDTPDSGLVIGSNTHLILAPNAILKLIATSHNNSCVLRNAAGATNIIIEGGTIDGNRAEHIGATGEAGMGIYLSGADKITIKNISCINCWGDGIIINSDGATHAIASTNIVLENVICDNNRRQGMSVIAVDGMIVANSKFINTSGTSPQCGVDIEPVVYTANTCKNIRFTNCDFSGNVNTGLIASIAGAVVISNIIVSNCKANANSLCGIQFVAGVKKSSIIGCDVSGTTNGPGILVSGCYDISISANVASLNSEQGIYVYGGGRVLVVGNSCCENTLNGIKALSSSLLSISDNTSRSNAFHGIAIESVVKSTITSNAASLNTKDGIQLKTSLNNVVSANVCESNGNYGIDVMNTSSESLVTGNYCIGNGTYTNDTYGNILVNNSDNCSVIGNVCRVGTAANKPLAGIIINWYGTVMNTIVANNDCYMGGTTNGIRNTGTNTQMGHNREIGGSWVIGGQAAAPVAGTWTVGARVYNSAPAAGGYEGWICTTAGTPGTWKGFGLIQA